MISLEQEDGLWIVTLDRPHKANALTEAMLGDLADIAEGASAARAFVLTGAGKVFSAGADLEAARLAALVGPARAKMILMAGARIDTAEAQDWGLFDRVVPRDALLPTARALAADCLGASPEHARSLKMMCHAPQT